MLNRKRLPCKRCGGTAVAALVRSAAPYSIDAAFGSYRRASRAEAFAKLCDAFEADPVCEHCLAEHAN